MPLIVYDSMTGNVKRFVSKLGYRSIQIDQNLLIEEPFILITYTIGHGNIPQSTKEFLSRNSFFLFGVASSGNKNWGSFYARAAKLISLTYNVPILHTFELSGTLEDVLIFKKEAEELCQQVFQNGFKATMKS